MSAAEPNSWDPVHLRFSLAVTAAAAPIVGVVVWWLRGGEGALSAVAGLALVALFFSLSALAVSKAGRIADMLTLPAAMTVYMFKIIALGVFLVQARDASWLDGRAFAWTIFVGTLGWMFVHAWYVWRRRIYYVDPSS